MNEAERSEWLIVLIDSGTNGVSRGDRDTWSSSSSSSYSWCLFSFLRLNLSSWSSRFRLLVVVFNKWVLKMLSYISFYREKHADRFTSFVRLCVSIMSLDQTIQWPFYWMQSPFLYVDNENESIDTDNMWLFILICDSGNSFWLIDRNRKEKNEYQNRTV
jgi:hypothetical protein